jgi:hypothetical protein
LRQARIPLPFGCTCVTLPGWLTIIDLLTKGGPATQKCPGVENKKNIPLRILPVQQQATQLTPHYKTYTVLV